MTTHTNGRCAVCSEAYNAINGRYCRPLGRYVEHHAVPQCGRENDTDKGNETKDRQQ